MKPIIKEAHILINPFSRLGEIRDETKIIDVHWTGWAWAHAAIQIRDAFAELARQNPKDQKPDRFAGSNYAVGIEGEIVELIPHDEMSFTAGANEYTEFIKEKLGESWCTNQGRNGNPNWCSVSIEICVDNWEGRFTKNAVNATAGLCRWLADKYELDRDDIVRHYDITHKICPREWVEDEHKWRNFLQRVEALKHIEE